MIIKVSESREPGKNHCGADAGGKKDKQEDSTRRTRLSSGAAASLDYLFGSLSGNFASEPESRNPALGTHPHRHSLSIRRLLRSRLRRAVAFFVPTGRPNLRRASPARPRPPTHGPSISHALTASRASECERAVPAPSIKKRASLFASFLFN